MKRIVLSDYVFKLGVRRCDGIVHAEQGIPMFYSERDGIVARLSFPVTYMEYEEPITVYIRHGESDALRELDVDDILEEDIRDYMLDITEQHAYLSDYLNEKRIQYLPMGLKWLGGALLTGFAVIILIILKLFKLSVVAGILTAIQLYWAWRILHVIIDTRIYDKNGRWFDVSTGHSNLNDDYTIEIDCDS